jgi:hypothetical protein
MNEDINVTIKRTEIEIITNLPVPIDEQLMSVAEAMKFLKSQINAISDIQIDEIINSEYTTFEWKEMINRGVAAYLGTVVYEIKTVG